MRAVPIAIPTASPSAKQTRYGERSVQSVEKRRDGRDRPAPFGLSELVLSHPFPQDPTTCPAGPTVTGIVPASAQSRTCFRRSAAVLDAGSSDARPNSQCSTHELETTRSVVPVLLRKEVIQPHLPVRLPCYDFVPIADPTFDGSLPYGLGHRLRVLPTFVT